MTNSARRLTTATLALALALGGFLRFSDLGARELSADEGASWAAAHVASVGAVLRLQPLLNPGKFAVHGLALFGWMGLFGDGLAAMRSLSALNGTLAIAAVFFIARELFVLDPAKQPARMAPAAGGAGNALAAFAALVFAVNLVSIKYAREARMYSLALLCALLQVGLFLQMVRRPNATRFVLVALFTALGIACTFTMTLLLPPEVLWLACMVWRTRGQVLRRAITAVGALAAGFVVLIPPAIIYWQVRASAPPLTAYAWASRPPLWAPLALFNKGTGSFAFPVMLLLVIWGAVGAWSSHRRALAFLLLWMLIPPLLLLIASYLVRPAFVERYVLASFVPFFVLVAFGICRSRGLAPRAALLVLVSVLALAHVVAYQRRPHDVQWREAVRVAAGAANEAGAIVVAPPYAVNVVRYYSRRLPRHQPVRPWRNGASAAAVIVADSGVSTAGAAAVAAAYPHLLASLRGVIVRGR